MTQKENIFLIWYLEMSPKRRQKDVVRRKRKELEFIDLGKKHLMMTKIVK